MKVETSIGFLVKVIENRNNFTGMIKNYEFYSKKNMDAYKVISDEIVDDIVDELADVVEKAYEEYAELLFINEFK